MQKKKQDNGTLLISLVDELTSLESDPLFKQLLEALYLNSLKHPEKLKNINEVWDEEWTQILESVDD